LTSNSPYLSENEYMLNSKENYHFVLRTVKATSQFFDVESNAGNNGADNNWVRLKYHFFGTFRCSRLLDYFERG